MKACGGLLRIAALDSTGSGQLTDAEADSSSRRAAWPIEEMIHFLNLTQPSSSTVIGWRCRLAVLVVDGLSTFDAIDSVLGGARSLGWYKRWT